MFRSLVGHFFKDSRPTLDNFVFRLHYRVTVGLLLTCAVVLLWKINYGNPISCMTQDGSSQYLNDQCWYEGTYTLPGSRYKIVGDEVPAPGIDVVYPGDTKQYQNVHRWVVIAVLVQAVLFYVPRILWRFLEGRLIHRLTWNMNDTKKTSGTKMFRKELIIGFLTTSSLKSLLYAFGCFACEIVNFINVVSQLSLISHILQMTFPTMAVLVESRSQRLDRSALSSFPMQVKCDVYRYGPSGAVQRHDVSCLMTVNGVIEAIFVYQWIWFALLTLLSVMAVFYRLFSLFISPLRTLTLSTKATLANYATVAKLEPCLGIGQWFLLYLLSKNLDPIDMKDILEELANHIVSREDAILLTDNPPLI